MKKVWLVFWVVLAFLVLGSVVAAQGPVNTVTPQTTCRIKVILDCSIVNTTSPTDTVQVAVIA